MTVAAPMFVSADADGAFRGELRDRGLVPPDRLIADGKIHRCDAVEKPGKRDGAYLLHLDGLPAGGIENHRDGLGWRNWCHRSETRMSPSERASHRARMTAARNAADIDLAARRAEARVTSERIWAEAAPCESHPYLAARGVRSHGLRVSRGALVIPLSDADGTLHSVQFVAADGGKRFLAGGQKKGCYYAIGGLDGAHTIAIAEGYATAATVHEATGHPTVMACNAGNLRPVAEAIRARHPDAQIVIVADDDNVTPGNPGLTAATEAARAVGGRLAVPDFGADRPAGATDANDLHQARGLDAVRACVEGAGPPAESGALLPTCDLAERPEIVVGPDESRVIDEAIAALAAAPEIYVRGAALVEVITDDPITRGLARGGPIARILTCAEARVRELLARGATWLGSDGAGGRRPIHPPQWLVRAVMARGQWRGIRLITSVATAPTMRPDGTILDRDGYDRATGIYLASTVAVQMSGRPSRDDARRAADTLLDVVADFPAGPAAKSAWLSGLVSVVARPAIAGPTPMTIVDASVRGAGKSLLVDVASIIATGRAAARMIYSRDDAEVRKMITALALVGDPLVLVDNVTGELGCAALDAALTADTWRDRVLGASEMTTEIPLRIVWYATGNGVSIGADLGRRSLLMRLEPACERPEERSGWRYPRLLDHVRAHRAELLGAALMLARAYVVAGRPDMRLTPMGSYECWSDLVRSALVWSGQPDPCGTIADLRAVDARGDALRAALENWPADDDEGITAADLVARATVGSPWRAALAEWVPARGADLPTARALGYALRAIRGRIVAGQTILAHRDRTGTARWARRRIGAGDARDDGDRTPLRGYDRVISPIGEMSPASQASPAGEESL